MELTTLHKNLPDGHRMRWKAFTKNNYSALGWQQPEVTKQYLPNDWPATPELLVVLIGALLKYIGKSLM